MIETKTLGKKTWKIIRIRGDNWSEVFAEVSDVMLKDRNYMGLESVKISLSAEGHVALLYVWTGEFEEQP